MFSAALKTNRFLITAFIFYFWSQTAFANDSQNIIDAIQKRYDETQTFKADFIQKSFLKVMGQTQTAKGEVIIKKPGRMKWDYTAPDPQILISDAKALWLFLPEESQVTKMQIGSIYSSNTPALFLAGKGKLTQTFNIGKVTRNKDSVSVELIPKESNDNIDRMTIFADNSSYQIIGSRVYDKLGNQTEMIFTNITINPDTPDETFHFQVPPGVELIDFTSSDKKSN